MHSAYSYFSKYKLQTPGNLQQCCKTEEDECALKLGTVSCIN